jgi:hypothetical protein
MYLWLRIAGRLAAIAAMALITFGLLFCAKAPAVPVDLMAGWVAALMLAMAGAVCDRLVVGYGGKTGMVWGLCGRMLKLVVAIGLIFSSYFFRGKDAVPFAMALLGGYLAFMVEEVFIVLTFDFAKRCENG